MDNDDDTIHVSEDSVFGRGIPQVVPVGCIRGIVGIEPLTECEALPLLEAMAERRRHSTRRSRVLEFALAHARTFGRSVTTREQQRAVRGAVFVPLAGYHSSDAEVPPAVEAAIMANVGVASAFEAEDVCASLADYGTRRKRPTSTSSTPGAQEDDDPPPRDLAQVIGDLRRANHINGNPPQSVEGCTRSFW
jgi:hypothetical protein